jgi:hypothetical protein
MNLANFVMNNWDSILAVGGLLGLWKHGKTKAIGREDLWDTLLQLGRQSFTALLHDKGLYNDAYVRDFIEKAIWKGLDRLKVPHSKLVETFVAEAVEHVKGELAAMVFKYHASQLAKPLQATADKLKGLPQEVPIDREPEPA